MMEKIIPVGSWDFQMEPTSLIKIASNGLAGADRRAFLEKRAVDNVFADMVSKIALHPGEIPIHTIAIGATEAYGPNRNGDGFDEATCMKQAATFVGKPLKDWTKEAHNGARFFRHHKNKDPQVSYGYVKAAAYNPRMRRIELLLIGNGTKEAADRNGGFVMPDSTRELLENGKDMPGSMACKVAYDVCLYAGSLIETRQGLKPIETISKGEIVRTHTGTWSPVTTTFQREYVGAVTELSVAGLPEQLRATCSHPFPVVRNETMQCTSKYRARGELRNARHRFNGGDTCGQCKTQIEELPYEWVDAQDICVGDWLIYPVQSPGDTAVPCPEAYMAGLYAGDGFPIYTRRGRKRDGEKYLTGYRISTENDPQFLSHVREISGYRLVDYADKENGRILEHRDRDLVNKFLGWIGQGCTTKTIQQEVFDWDEQSRWTLLAGCVDSDGNASDGKPRFLTTNRQLAYWVQRLLWGLGHNASCAKMPCTGDWAKAEFYYQVSFDLSAAVKLRDHGCYKLRNCREPKRPKHPVILDGYICLRVTETTSRHDETDVFNLEVDGDNSYIYEMAVHNCQNCFNKAATRAHYCTSDTCINPHDGFKGLGCRYGLTKLASNGRQQFVENPNSVFFDWSEVIRPADRNAFGGIADYLLKAASDGHIMGGAELAEYFADQNGYGFEFNWEPCRDKIAHQRQLVNNLAALEQQLESRPSPEDLDYARAFLPSMQPPVDLSPLGKVGSVKLASGLKALADRSVLLTPTDFLRLVSGADGEKLATYVATIARHLPGVFTRLSVASDLDHQLRSNTFATGDGLPLRELRNFATKVAATRSCDPAVVQERAQLSAIRKLAVPTKLACSEQVKTAAADVPGEYLARQYALYKVAFLAAQSSEGPGLPLTSRLVVLQNYII